MMKNLTVIVLAMLFAIHSFAIDWTGIRADQPKPGIKQLVSSNIDESTIRFSLDGFISQPVNTPMGESVIIGLGSTTPIMGKGAPDLPKMTASVIIPDLGLMNVEILEAVYQDYENVLVAPSKGNFTRDIDPASVPYEFGIEYQQNAFYPGILADLRDPYILRDYRGQTLIVYPFQYNPVTRTLRVYTDITVKISKVEGASINPLIRTEQPERIDAQFRHIYNRQFLNYSNASRYNPVDEYGNFLIISYGAFMEAMEPFITWKTQVGYPVEIVDVATIGNSTAIKSFISSYYNSNGLTFVLLVGDAAQVPTSMTSAGDSDNNYSYIVGNDHYPDLFIGRFSAENVEQVQTQVQRTLTYEQNPPVGVDWFTICTGVASNQGPGDDGEYDYQHIRNIQNSKLIPFTYTYGNELFDGSQGGNDAPGNPTSTQVATAINTGTSIINYTGHGSNTSWSSSGFSNSHVNSLVNDNMLPFVFSVACVNGNFVGTTCFAEAWLRATNNGQPTGAIAFLGSTINQSWNPPMCGQDEMNDVLAEAYQNNIKRTFGAISMHGCMLMNDEYGSGGIEMTDTWTCFGDPSVMVRTAMPQTMSVTHEPVLFLGFTQLSVNCDAEGARATLTMDGAIISTAVVENGTAMLEFEELSDVGMATLSVTAFNYLPYSADIEIVPAAGPYLIMVSYQINDAEGNNDGMPDYNEPIGFTFNMKNVGIEDANNVTFTISTPDQYISITDPTELVEVVPAGQSITLTDAFAIQIACDIPDQHNVIISLVADDGNTTWEAHFELTINAPVINIYGLIIDDAQDGNGDGKLDPGETAELTIHYSNTGHIAADEVGVYLEGQSGFTEISNPWHNFASIGIDEEYTRSFTVTVDEDAPAGIIVNFVNELIMCGHTFSQVFPLKISTKCEDFETGDFTLYEWQQGGTQPWQIISSDPFQGTYSIKSGEITHNESSEIMLEYEVMQPDSIIFFYKVSSESSDYLKFYVDNTILKHWSGTASVWKREAFAVSPGMHTFKWVYQKSSLGSAGSDCAWLDFIVLPSPMVLTIWAGPDDQVCGEQSYPLTDAYGTNFVQAEWTSSGSGTFDNNTNINPEYYPSEDDYANGEVQLTLMLWDDQNNMLSDEILIGLLDIPAIPETPQGPEFVNLAEIQVSEYQVMEITGVDVYLWHLEPAEAGIISGNDNYATVNWSLEFTGSAFITVAGSNQCGDGDVSQALEVIVDNFIVTVTEPKHDIEALRIYPNPVMDVLNVEFTDTRLADSDIRLFNMMGSTMASARRYDHETMVQISVNHLSPGVYLLMATSADQQVTRKVIINRSK